MKQFYHNSFAWRTSFIAMVMMLVTTMMSAQFTPGRLVILRNGATGQGSAPTSAGTALFLDEYTVAGSAGITVALPTTTSGNINRIVGSGSATSEGQLNLSSDGSILMVGGYDAAIGTASVGSVANAARVVARIDNTATVATTLLTTSDATATNNSYSTNNFRSVTSADGTRYWTGGNGSSSTGGIRSIAFSSSTTTAAIAGQVSSTTTNVRIAKIFNGQLYYSTSGGIFKVGTGLPTSSGTVSTALFTPQTGNSSTYSYIFLDRDATVAGPDVMYVSDDGSGASGSRGVYKYSFDGTSWTSRGSVAYTLGTNGLFGLTGTVSGGSAILYATTTTSVVAITDNAAFNATMTGTFSTLITAPTNTFFRGIAFAPSSGCTTPSITSVTSNTPICSSAILNLNVSATGTAPLTYAWTGTGSFSSTSVANPTVTGAASGTYTVTVTNGCGSSTSSTLVVVNVPVTPTVSITANPGNTICAGINTIFTATPVDGGSTPAYQWFLNGNPVGTNSNTFSSTSLNQGDQIFVVLTSNANCITTPTATSNTITMMVNPSVVPTITIAAVPASTICAGSSVTFNATVTNEGTLPTYQWYVNGLPVGTNSNSFSSSLLVNGDIVSCGLTSNAICALPSSVTSNIITMIVTALVTPTISITVIPSSTICSGSNATFTASITNGGSLPSFQWLLNGNPVGTNSNTYSNNALGNGSLVECVLTSNEVCVTTATANSNQITMTVGTSIIPSITISESANSICSGTNVTFTASILNGGTTPSYQWQVNGTNAGINSATFNSSSLANGDVVTCILTSNDACASPSTATSNSVTMIVTPVVVPSVTISANPGISICQNTTVTFTANPVNEGTLPVYVWKLNGNIVGSNAPTYVNSILANGDIVSVELTSDILCATPATVSSSVTISVNAAPSVSVSPLNYTLLTGRSVSVSASGAVNYLWAPGGELTSSISVNPTVSTIYTVTGTDANGCTSSATSNITVINSYTAGNIIVQRVGSGGASPLTSGSTANFLDEYNTSTLSFVKTTTVPVTGSNRLTTSGSATSEAQLTRSSNKSNLVFSGYDATTGVSSINGTSGTSVNRIAEICDYKQTIVRAAATTSYSANNIRSATSDGTNFWSAGANTGTVLMTTGAGVIVQNTITNTRVTKIFNGQLYFSSATVPAGIYAVGTGLPLTSGNTNTLVVTTGTSSSPYAFAFNSTSTICYVADDRSSASGGIQKYAFNGTSWVLSYTLGTGATNVGARGLEVDFSGPNPIIYATTGEASSNRIIRIIDSGASSPATTIATAPTNTAFRGLAFAPECAPASQPLVSVVSVQNSCSGATNGSIDISVSNGNSPYSYSWSNGASSEDISSLLPGTYSVTVVDNSGCSSVSLVSVSPIASPTVTITGSTTFCPSSSTILDAGAGYSSYLWSPNGETTQTISAASAGTYSVVVTNGVGCTGSASVIVTAASNPVVTISGNTEICSGGSTILDAGSGFASYLWSPNGQTTQTITVNSAGLYSVTVSNTSGCTASASVTITETPGIIPVISGSSSFCAGGSVILSTSSGYDTYLWSPNGETTNSITVTTGGTYSVSVTSGSCSGTSAPFVVVENTLPVVSVSPLTTTTCANIPVTLTATGASTYSWSPAAGLNNTNNFEVIATVGTSSIYTVVGTDVNGCTASATSSININASPIVSVSPNQIGVCAGESATLTANGAASYSWSPITGLNVSTGAVVISTPIASTVYTVTGSDGNGCSATATANVIISDILDAPIVNTPVTYCLNATATALTAIPAANSTLLWYANPTGGTGSAIAPVPSTTTPGSTFYYVSSAPSQDISIAITGFIDNGTPDLFSFVALTEIPAGAKIYFTDNGWTGLAFRGVNTTNYVGNEGLVRFDAVNAIPAGTVIISYSTSPNYNWISTGNIDPANPSYGVYTQPAFSTSGDQIYAFLSNVPTNPQGNVSKHLFVFDDTFGFEPATSASQGAIPAGLSAADGTAITMTTVNNYIALINDGFVRSIPMWFTYIKDTANNYTKISNFNNLLPPLQTVSFNVISACESPRSAIEVSILDAPIPDATSNGPVCSGSDINLFSDPFSFFIGWNWTGPNGFTSLDQNPIITGATSVNSGDYTVIVTDFNGCTASQTISVFVSSISLTAVVTNTNCSGGSTGSIDLTVANGVGPYTYLWSNSEITEDISTLAAGSYTVTVTDAIGCTASATFTVQTQNTQSNVSVTATPNPICAGSSSLLEATGADTYVWSPSTGLNTINGSIVTATPAVTTTYTVTATDLSGCPSIVTITLTVNQLPVFNVTPATSTICEGSSVTLTASGTLSYSWSPSASLNNSTSAVVIASPVSTTTYTVTGTDLNGCSSSGTSTVNVINTPVPTVTTPVTYCKDAVAVALSATATSGYSLRWYSVPTGGTASGTAPVPSTATAGTQTYYVSQLLSGSVSIAITGWFDGGSPDVFGFNALNVIPSGTVIYFTDNGWTGTGFRGVTSTNGAGNEGLSKWTAINDIPAGTLILSNATSPNFAWTNAGTIAGTTSIYSALAFSSSGDQIYAFTSTATSNPQFNTASMTHLYVFDDTNGFENATTSATGNIPPGLTSGITANSFNFAVNSFVGLINDGQTRTISNWYTYIGTPANYQFLALPSANLNIDLGCESPRVPIVVNVNDSPVASATADPVLCNGGTTIVNVTATGGTLPYTGTGAFTVSAGSYNYTVTDINGCNSTTSISISEPTILVSSVSLDSTINCFGGTTTVTVSATGGTSPYTGIGSFIVSAGLNTFTVTDANGCVSQSQITVTQPAQVSILTISPATGCPGTLVTITGTNLDLVTSVDFAGTSSPFTLINSQEIQTTVHAGAVTGLINLTSSPLCVVSSASPFVVTTCNTGLAIDLKLFLQAYYIGGGSMQSVLLNQNVAGASAVETDSILVQLWSWDGINQPVFVDESQAVLMNNGAVHVEFSSALPDDYFLSVKHRSSIETWSSVAISISQSLTFYDFTLSSSAAFGDNMAMTDDGKWAIYSGDLNSDGFVDIFDYPSIDADNFNFISLEYVNTDLNGDGYVDIFDYPILDANNSNFVSSQHP